MMLFAQSAVSTGVGKRIEEGVGTTQSAQVSDSASPPSIPATLTRLEQNPQQSEEERDCQVDLQEQQQGCSNSSSLRDGGVSPPAAKRSRSSNFPHHTPNNPHTWHFSHHTEPIYPTSAYLPLAEKSLGSEITDAEPLPQAAMFASDTPLNDSYPDVHSATKSIFQAGTSPLSAQYYGSAVYNGQSLPYGMQGAAGLYAGQSAAAVQQSYYAATRGLKGSPSLPPSYALNPYFPAASATPGTAGYYGGYGGQALDYGYAAAYPSTAQYYGTTGGATLPPSGYGSGYGGPAVTTTTTYQLAQLPPCTSLSGAVTEPNVQYSINDLSPFAKTEPKKAKSKKKKVANPSPTPDGEYERVFIWELEDVALICHSLLDGNYASKFGKSVSERDDLARLGALMQAMVRALTENHFIVNDLEDCDQVHIEDVGMDETGQEIAGYNFSAEGFQLGPAGTPLCLGPTAAGMRGGVDWMRKLACRYRRVRDMYSLYRDNPPALEGLLGPTVEGKQLREVRAELDRLCDSWHALAFKCLAIVSQRPRHANVVVSSGQLVHSAAMVLTYGLGPVFPIENIYSATKIGREACYERVMSRFGKKCTYVVVGAGEEEHSAKQLQVPFWRVSTHSDLAALHHAFEGGYL